MNNSKKTSFVWDYFKDKTDNGVVGSSAVCDACDWCKHCISCLINLLSVIVNVPECFPCDILTKLQIQPWSDLEKANLVQPCLTQAGEFSFAFVVPGYFVGNDVVVSDWSPFMVFFLSRAG